MLLGRFSSFSTGRARHTIGAMDIMLKTLVPTRFMLYVCIYNKNYTTYFYIAGYSNTRT
jgi:hypothetical protein